jgi:hypothetical protein
MLTGKKQILSALFYPAELKSSNEEQNAEEFARIHVKINKN